MSKRIHHRCCCLDRNFTFEEWGEYLRENPSGGVVLTFGKFGFNINDVCLTPNTPVDIRNKFCALDIETAQSQNGRWDYGIHLSLYHEGSSHGARFIDNSSEGFPSEKEAIFDALLYSEQRTVRKIKETEERGDRASDEFDEESFREPKNSAILSSLRAFLKEIQRYKQYYDPKQLSLFDI